METSKKGFRHGLTRFKKQLGLQGMVIPWIVWAILFCYIPMCGIIIAFKDYRFADGIFGSEWVGLEHFKSFVSSPDFVKIIRNTLGINILKILFSFPLPIIFTLLLNELRGKHVKRITQSVSYLPHFISWVIVAGIFSSFFSREGLLNNLLMQLHILDEPIMWQGEPWFFWPLMVITGTWKEMGWSAIIYIAALSSLNPELLEAADVDGASRWQKIIHIKLPSLMPTITVTLLFTLAGVFTAGFDQIFLFQNSMVLDTAEVLDTYIYKTGLSNSLYSYAAAGGLFQSIINFIIIFFSNKMAKRINGVGLW